MEKKDLEFFRHLLTQWLEELLNRDDDTVEELLDSQENLADPLDRVSVESERIWTLRIRDRESMLIKKIRQSLEDIETGEYGICEDCGEDISIERLKARPVTSFCIHCKTKRESVERLTGT
jgi:DnaK suppressor protein